jgi:hypothetical protein
MRNLKLWLFGVFVGAVLSGLKMSMASTPTARAEDKVAKDHWRHHDGHWSHWNEQDKRWYYTDGTHWYYNDNDNDAWKVYRFDKKFGREGFEQGEYKVPAEDAKVVVPKHSVYRSR